MSWDMLIGALIFFGGQITAAIIMLLIFSGARKGEDEDG